MGVSQVFCAAPKVNTSFAKKSEWEPFARLLLEATYEATLWAAVDNLCSAKEIATDGCNVIPAGSSQVLLTLVGGGVFGNELEWIVDAINRAIAMVAADAPVGGWGLEVCMMHFKSINPALEKAIYCGAPPSATLGDRWTCSACTCINSELASQCVACGKCR